MTSTDVLWELVASGVCETQIGMNTYALHDLKRHLFVEVDGGFWLLDTGAPLSFGEVPDFAFAGIDVHLQPNYGDLTVEAMSQYLGVKCVGLLGGDVLNRFDHILDLREGTISVSEEELSHEGTTIETESFMGIPIIEIEVQGARQRMIFDTGAQISYLLDDPAGRFPSLGVFDDFHPALGCFKTATYEVPIRFGSVDYALPFGVLPAEMHAILEVAGTAGILGNEVLHDRVLGYFPRRRELVF
jgi:hypothetical protein